MISNGKLVIAKCGEEEIGIVPKLANRHGLVAGATGTGKTVTLRTMAEAFSDAGVPVFLADVKGDLAGMMHDHPVTFWDLFGKQGLPLRTTISEMGPTLLARLMELTKVQEDILTMVFKIADDEGLLLLDSKDLRSMIGYVAEHAQDYSMDYGNMSKASLNVIQRTVIALEEEGADQFFGEPALDIRDWFKTNLDGKGMVNILHSESLIGNPKMYATFMLWLMSELFEILPEAGDLEKPRMVFFFDEAHLLFNSAPKALLEKIDQVVKLIRSKGVGIYFITQNPRDLPDSVLAQLGNKVQHALHAYTPAEQKAIKAAAQSFRANPAFDTGFAIETLGIGEALISFLQEDGTPSIVQRAKVLLPPGQLGPIDDVTRQASIASNELAFKYKGAIDRDSAYEFLQRKRVEDEEAAQEAAKQAEREKEERKAQLEAEKEQLRKEKEAQREEIRQQKEAQKEEERVQKEAQKQAEKSQRELEREAQKQLLAQQKAQAAKDREAKKVVSSVARTTGGTIGREIGNTLGKSVGGSFGKKLGGNVGASLGRGILGNLFGK